MSPEPTPPTRYSSPYWSSTTKIIVVVFTLIIIALLLMRFRTLVGMLVIAAILAYLLDPLISFIDRRTNLRRGVIIGIIYLILAIALLAGFSAVGIASFQQIGSLIQTLPDIIQNLSVIVSNFVNRNEPLQIGPFVITPTFVPWDLIADQFLGFLEPVLSQSTTVVSRFATSTVRTVFNAVFIFIISLYLARDLPRLGGYVKSFAQQPGYSQDVEQLMPEFRRIWRSYLRGQIILALVIFLTVWMGLTILGVQNSLALGLLGGLLEFVPTLGPIISAGVAILVAVFQPTNYLGLGPWQYALAILILMIVIQQVENNFLVPRIVGGALDLHPILVIVAVFMGASLAGILGAILAAPVAASIKLLTQYVWRKLFDLPPFPLEPSVTDPPPSTGAVEPVQNARSSNL
jgi:predicted PurR-regulated permease PerM